MADNASPPMVITMIYAGVQGNPIPKTKEVNIINKNARTEKSNLPNN